MSANTYNLRQIFKKAHWNASWKRAGGDKRDYRVIFADCLRQAYGDARRQAERVAESVTRPAYVPAMSRNYYIARPRHIAAIGW